jgi:hypothetical protein
MNIKRILLSTSIGGALLLGACTNTQLTSGISAACTALGAGLSVTALVAGQVAGGATIATTVSNLINDVSTDCPSFATAVTDAAAAITGLGQTATVSVTATSTTAASLRRMGVAHPVFNFSVSPSGTVTVSPSTVGMMKRMGY